MIVGNHAAVDRDAQSVVLLIARDERRVTLPMGQLGWTLPWATHAVAASRGHVGRGSESSGAGTT